MIATKKGQAVVKPVKRSRFRFWVDCGDCKKTSEIGSSPERGVLNTIFNFLEGYGEPFCPICHGHKVLVVVGGGRRYVDFTFTDCAEVAVSLSVSADLLTSSALNSDT